MEISAAIVKKLRDATNAGMMDCKKALVEAKGDFDKAERLLKEMGLAAVAKRADRATNNGRVFTLVKENKAVILEMACETDFVARNKDFIALGEELCEDVIANSYTEITPPLTAKVEDLITMIKENMSLKRFTFFTFGENAIVSQYIHGEGTLGVLVTIEAEDASVLANEAVKEFAFDSALHVAAFSPLYLAVEDVDEAYIEEQSGIFLNQAKELDKPEKVVQGIVKGKLNKHLSEICFLEQPFVKDDSLTVKQALKALSKEVGSELKITSYINFKVGVEE